MPDLSKILAAQSPLTLTSVARGSQPLVLADLARAARGRVVFVAPDEAAMQAVADGAGFFAPELEVLTFPAWDCLPYDRASPALSVSARRLSALYRLQGKVQGPQLLVTTINALLQRVLTPFRIRESVRLLEPGMSIGRESLIALLQRQGYSRTDTVADAGEYAVRGSLFDIYPSGLEAGLRLDFFGDELETLRLFDPNTQRSTGWPSATCCSRRARRCWMKTASNASAAATANSSAPMPPAIRCTRRSAKGGDWRGWSTGCRCSKTGWPRCSTTCSRKTCY